MSALNLTNVKTGIFNDVFMVQNTGYSSIYNIFGSKAEISSLSGMNTTTLSQISATITGFSTLNSALATKASITSVSNINNTLTSMLSDIDNNSAGVIELSITQQSIITGLSTLNTILATKANAADVYDTLWIDEALATKASLTSVSNINTTLPSLITFDYLTTTYWTNTLGTIDSKISINNGTQRTNIYNTLGSYLLIDNFNATLTSSLSSYTPLTFYNNTITTRLDSQLSSINNINITLPSLITNSTLSSNLNNYTPLSFYNNTILTRLNTDFTNISNLQITTQSLITTSTLSSNLNNYTPLTTYNNTILTRLDSQLTSINNINTTLPSLITSSTLSSNLNNYTPLTTYNNTILTRLNTNSTQISNLQTTTQSLITSATLSSTLTNYPIYQFDGTNNNITSGNMRYHNWISITSHSLIYDLGFNKQALFQNSGATFTGASHFMSAGTTGDLSLNIKNFASGTSSLYLNTNNTLPCRIWSDPIGNLNVQAYTTTSTIKFFTGATNAYTISSGGGVNGSDIRFKSGIENITNALSKIKNLQGKTFYLNNNPNRQFGFIAQEVLPIVPEAVFVDESDDNRYHYLYYDKLVSLLNEGVKEVDAKITSLESRVSLLENK